MRSPSQPPHRVARRPATTVIAPNVKLMLPRLGEPPKSAARYLKRYRGSQKEMPPIAKVIAVIAAVFSVKEGIRNSARTPAAVNLGRGLVSASAVVAVRGSRMKRHSTARIKPGIATK